MARARDGVWFSTLGLLVFGCGTDLGPCDQREAERVVYGPLRLQVTAGQALMHDSCGGGAFCHTQQAVGINRLGAPKGLDFDMVPDSERGWRIVMQHRDEVWGAVEAGSMPPPSRDVWDNPWYYSVDRNDEDDRLPTLATDEGREVFRNWLACKAPIVEEVTMAPSPRPTPTPARPDAGMGQMPEPDAGPDTGTIEPLPEWSDLYVDVLAPSCATARCHDGTGAGGLAMDDMCNAYRALFQTGSCNMPRVEAGEDDSFLIDKVTATTPKCGGRMPPIAPLPETDVDRIIEWIESGASSSDCK